jgi:hypothetical protein
MCNQLYNISSATSMGPSPSVNHAASPCVKILPLADVLHHTIYLITRK